jgi:drug/metabolite transporter (DMT)-like permease
MSRYWTMLLTLAAVWGASYLFIKVAVEDIEPAPMMAFRTLLAAAFLLGYVVWRLGRERALGSSGPRGGTAPCWASSTRRFRSG